MENALTAVGLTCALVTAVSAVISLTMLRGRRSGNPAGDTTPQRDDQRRGDTEAAAEALSAPE